jgi:nitroimidazol reductase NimA-like FMN-containing flavoprotein (pyridoxamine 5'-phosphate oxidase superfamily)
MRRKEKEITRREDLEEILSQASVVHLGLVDNGRPYVVPMDFGYADNAIYVHSAMEGRKIDVLKRNPDVCFEIETDHAVVPGDKHNCRNWTSRFKCVMGTGRAVFLTDPEERNLAVNVIMSKFAPGPFTFDDARVAKTALIKIEIESMTGKIHGY